MPPVQFLRLIDGNMIALKYDSCADRKLLSTVPREEQPLTYLLNHYVVVEALLRCFVCVEKVGIFRVVY